MNFDFLDFAIGFDRHRYLHRTVNAARARLFGVIEIADAFDFLPPVVDVGREAIFLRAPADELPPWPLLIRAVLLGYFRFEPRDFDRFLHQ